MASRQKLGSSSHRRCESRAASVQCVRLSFMETTHPHTESIGDVLSTSKWSETFPGSRP